MVSVVPKTVPVLVFEDTYLGDGAELNRSVGFPLSRNEGGQTYVFDWHSVYNALSAGMVLIRSLEAYQAAFDFLRNGLTGDAILFLDLEFQNNDQTLAIPEGHITDELFGFMKCLDRRVDSPAHGLELFNPERLGLLLAFAAARNKEWQGVISFVSGRQIVDPNDLRVCLDTGDRIQWLDAGGSLRRGTQAFARRVAIVNKAIECFLGDQQGPPFWPERTEAWFTTPTSKVPHDPPKDHNKPVVVGDVRSYLEELLPGFAVPETWFGDFQWSTLYEVLKGMLGAHSVAGGTSKTNRKNLRLAGIPLLLAAQMAWRKADITWFASFTWKPEDEESEGILEEVMKHTQRADAQEAIRAMAFFLAQLGFSRDGSNQVIAAKWGDVPEDPARHLWIDFKLDPLNRARGKSLLQTIFGSRWGNGSGQTVDAYVRMMESAHLPGFPSAPLNFSLCIYPVVNDDERITRLDFRAIIL